ncbi:hypothetical protein BZL30_6035 [Mycobacterium kansasii]|uniref:Uncharacterized protein n=1 Tax=Mycobacterium kansasii TaxID=1768 RepID=A0A1V3WVA7_MYCKA|nr:hypothetical protein BZL30_6035 [Mycobacterium kansasii]
MCLSGGLPPACSTHLDGDGSRGGGDADARAAGAWNPTRPSGNSPLAARRYREQERAARACSV